ncbi:hypothetical protein CKS_1977 [Pantoea stewartii subsp. stewartii DC283]|uniref:Uncharacterized protein n=1 Tax=Pantoea stewartii subsp. stewartii DC283 TaxID=660596 RepID=H3RF80_PANSE|nr:hypothetical protein CKS_1977 [Pantoea stewartii subsp. stewartii DC283]
MNVKKLLSRHSEILTLLVLFLGGYALLMVLFSFSMKFMFEIHILLHRIFTII